MRGSEWKFKIVVPATISTYLIINEGCNSKPCLLAQPSMTVSRFWFWPLWPASTGESGPPPPSSDVTQPESVDHIFVVYFVFFFYSSVWNGEFNSLLWLDLRSQIKQVNLIKLNSSLFRSFRIAHYWSNWVIHFADWLSRVTVRRSLIACLVLDSFWRHRRQCSTVRLLLSPRYVS